MILVQNENSTNIHKIFSSCALKRSWNFEDVDSTLLTVNIIFDEFSRPHPLLLFIITWSLTFHIEFSCCLEWCLLSTLRLFICLAVIYMLGKRYVTVSKNYDIHFWCYTENKWSVESNYLINIEHCLFCTHILS